MFRDINTNKILEKIIPLHALKFDGVADYVQTNFSLNIANDHTFSFDLKINSVSLQWILGNYRSDQGAGGFVIVVNNLDLFFGVFSPTIGNDNCTIKTVLPITIGEYINVIIVKSTQTRANWKIYINGIEMAVDNIGAINTAGGVMTGNQLTIGALIFNAFTIVNFLNGVMKNTKIFNTAFTASQALDLHNGGNVLPANKIFDAQLIYPTNITTLDSSVPIPIAPSFSGTYFGRPPLMTLANDFEQLTAEDKRILRKL